MSFKARLLAAFLALLATTGCATAESQRGRPATGKDASSFLLNEESERKLGAQEHPKVLAEFGGPARDPKAQAFVERVGNAMKDVSELAGETFTFTLLDSPIPNAFALPGGYVYVTRGLLALANNEAEVAGVLGHEVGHVTARHTAQRYDRQVVGGLGAAAAQVFGGLFGGYLGGEAGARLGAQLGGQAGNLGAQAWVQGFSREQEFEADQLGIEYLGRAGYDPRAMGTFLEALQANDAYEAARSGRRQSMPSWLSSHPRTPDRVARAGELVSAETPGARKTDRAAYLAAVDGIVYGGDPAQGVVRGRTFLHPDLRIAFEVPEGFRITNTPSAVLATDGSGRFIQFTMDESRSRDLRAYLQEEWVREARLQDLQGVDVGGRPAAVGFAQAQINGRPATAMFAAARGPGSAVYRFVFADAGQFDQRDVRTFEAGLRSLRALSDREIAGLVPTRVRLVTVRPGDTVESLARQMEVDEGARELFVLLNGLDRGWTLQEGDKVKVLKRG